MFCTAKHDGENIIEEGDIVDVINIEAEVGSEHDDKNIIEEGEESILHTYCNEK